MTNSKINLAQIVTGLSYGGGVEWVVYEIVKNIDKSIFHPIIFCLVSEKEYSKDLNIRGLSDHILLDNIKSQKLEIIFLECVSSPNPKYWIRNFSAIIKLSRYFTKKKIDIVQTHEFFTGTLGRIAAIIAKVPVKILMVHNCDRWKRSYHILIDRFLSKKTDIIVANSDSVKKFTSAYENIPINKFITIYNGVDLRRFENSVSTIDKRRELDVEHNQPIICVTARMAVQKGYEYLIKAIPRVIKEFPQMKLLIIGGGGVPSETTEEEIKSLVKTLGLTNKVKFLGWRKDVGEILSICDLFALPSLWEGFGLSIVEAMAAGKPVVATNVDAIPEVVSDGETGILVPPKNSGALANAILSLLKDPEKMIKMGQAGKKRAFTFFSAERMVKDYEKLYLSIFSKKAQN